MVRSLRVFYWVVTERLIIRSGSSLVLIFFYFFYFYCNFKKVWNQDTRDFSSCQWYFDVPIGQTTTGNSYRRRSRPELERPVTGKWRTRSHAPVEASASGLHSPAVSWRVEARAVASGWLLLASVSSCGDARTSDLFWPAAHWKGL